MLIKSPYNPIIKPMPDLKWASQKVYNSAAILHDNVYHLFFRAIGEDYISRIGHATSNDGEHFTVEPKPVFEPLEQWEHLGCEDPRITKIDDQYVMAYTAFDGLNARVALSVTTDFVTWSTHKTAFPNWREGRHVDLHQHAWNKAAALFPEKINGKYHLFFGDDHIWQASSDDLINWAPIKDPVLQARDGYFDSGYIEMGPPPIRTDTGWLILYHGINSRSNNRIYRLGAAIVDYNDPSKVIWRCKKPILEPTEPFERIGKIDTIEGGMDRLSHIDQKELEALFDSGDLPQAVFCCGAVETDGKINIYYSGGDTVLCVATCTLADITNGNV